MIMLHICIKKRKKQREKGNTKQSKKERWLMKMCGFCTVFNLSPPLNTVLGLSFKIPQKKKKNKTESLSPKGH